jgi:hypothetical protein
VNWNCLFNPGSTGFVRAVLWGANMIESFEVKDGTLIVKSRPNKALILIFAFAISLPFFALAAIGMSVKFLGALWSDWSGVPDDLGAAAMWCVFTLMLWRGLIWLLRAHEILVVTKDAIDVEQFDGFKARKLSYSEAEIRDLRMANSFPGSGNRLREHTFQFRFWFSPLLSGNVGVRFKARNRTNFLGLDLNLVESKQLIKGLKEVLPPQRFSKS